MSAKGKHTFAECPVCHEDVAVPARPRLNYPVTCRGCRTELEVVEQNPVVLDLRETEALYRREDRTRGKGAAKKRRRPETEDDFVF